MSHPTTEQVGLHFGALAPPIRQQLREQGIRVTTALATHWQDCARCLTMVRLHHLVPESAARAGEQRLLKAIAFRLKQDGKL